MMWLCLYEVDSKTFVLLFYVLVLLHLFKKNDKKTQKIYNQIPSIETIFRFYKFVQQLGHVVKTRWNFPYSFVL